MTRIVAGRAGGRTLQVPPRGTRPTSDRVREALFSRLEHADAVQDAVVLDLYAGSGALGLEAASRGAAEVVLVEHARAAAEVCRRNVTTVGLSGVRVVQERVLPYLQRSGPTSRGEAGGAVGLALVDPPYELDEADLAAVLDALVEHLTPSALVVVERSSRSPEPRWPAATDTRPGLGRTGERRYGETVLWFAAPEAAGPVAAPGAAPTVADTAPDEDGGDGPGESAEAAAPRVAG